ncbi:MAG: hypothetical protein R3E84_20455 [Pseudomonadales bacterium]
MCIDKVTCARVPSIVPRWQAKAAAVRQVAEVKQELARRHRILDTRSGLQSEADPPDRAGPWLDETLIEIISEAQNEVADFRKWADIYPAPRADEAGLRDGGWQAGGRGDRVQES